MGERLNCWEIKGCGRGPGGSRVAELGPCPVVTYGAGDGINHGTNGGRICWAVAGTLCDGKIQGSFAAKQGTCQVCEVFLRVKQEEGARFSVLTPEQLRKILRVKPA